MFYQKGNTLSLFLGCHWYAFCISLCCSCTNTFFAYCLHFSYSSVLFFFFPCFQSVVNLISELQEQMCRLQLEINSRIQERKSQDRKSSVTPNGPQSSPRSVVETLGQKNCSQCDVREVYVSSSLCIASTLLLQELNSANQGYVVN